MFGFSLAKIQILSFETYHKGAFPGELYWQNGGHYRIGIMLHVSTILVAGLLMVWQFVPIIRHKFILFHRINGYVVILLTLASEAGAIMIVRRSFGGALSTQAAVGVMTIAVTLDLVLAWINVKRLQIDQHRAWMLRAMVLMGAIITTRIIMVISALMVSMIGSYASTMTCGELRYMYSDNLEAVSRDYAACDPSGHNLASKIIAVPSNTRGDLPQLASAFRLGFGMSLWMALTIHAIGTEIYLNLTPRESNRLRQISYEKQLEAGYKNPGSAGLVAENFGDADPWRPNTQGKAYS